MASKRHGVKASAGLNASILKGFHRDVDQADLRLIKDSHSDRRPLNTNIRAALNLTEMLSLQNAKEDLT